MSYRGFLSKSKGKEAPTRASIRQLAEDTASDSGYGGSIAGDSTSDLTRPIPILQGHSTYSTDERRQYATHIQQLHYNQNRVALGRAINKTVETLKEFQQKNAKWPAGYPQVVKPEPTELQRSDSSISIHSPKSTEPPRLVTPTIAQEFNVLKLDLKLGALSPLELVHSLEKSSIASLLDGKILQAIKHLQALRERIEDTSSKVLVTGDLNAGKSTFCNALLRKKVLPEDQQPCTSIFCEVLDCRENGGIEEVHAVHKDVKYNRLDESTYDVYNFEQLEEIVVDTDEYSQAKIYVEDERTIDQSLLRNGVVDIALIDAPGLNLDSVKTTAVFARQEEIDVVVFVVSAENHFTQSAKEFINTAAHEKAYIFIVVNRFDNIRDKARCKRMILDQVQNLSPRTYQNSDELVHFVSSNAIIDGDDPNKMQDFNRLEENLRSFVLEKRARSKLAPAKTYLLNLLGDIETLADSNKDAVAAELEHINAQLEALAPQYEVALRDSQRVSDDVDHTIDDTVSHMYRHTRKELSTVISHMDDAPCVAYDGLLSAYNYAEETRKAMLQNIQNKVTTCEQYAREKTVQGVSTIKALGVLHLKEDYIEKTFRPELMFNKKRDALGRSIKSEVDLFDFFDFDKQEKVAGAGLSLTLVATVSTQVFGIGSWADSVWKVTRLLGYQSTKKLIVPVAIAATIIGTALIISDIPRAVPRKLAKKIRKELAEMDYVHGNSDRISKEVRKVLKFPADDLRSGFQKVVEKTGKERDELNEKSKESEFMLKYFGKLYKEAMETKRGVEKLDLENLPVVN